MASEAKEDFRTTTSSVESRDRITDIQLLHRRRKLDFENKVFAIATIIGIPASVCALVLLWHGGYSPKVVITIGAGLVFWWIGGALILRHHIVHVFRTLSNLLMAIREGDFSIRAAAVQRDDILAEVFREVNTFSDTLRTNRLDALEATALMRKVMGEIDVAVFAFGDDARLRFINSAGEQLIGFSQAKALDRPALELGLEPCLANDEAHAMELNLPGGSGRFGIRRGKFRLGGIPHQILLLTNLNQTLRHEEREAWQRLLRVLGHEINNSLTPIKSMAGSLASIVQRDPLPPDWKSDASQVLAVIESRAAALGRFTTSYARLAKLPRPDVKRIELASLVQRVCGLENRMSVQFADSQTVYFDADPDQLEQALINLVTNAVDSALSTNGFVKVSWKLSPTIAEIEVRDTGQGIANESNLFVPFFTTKPTGTGIGLVLSRQIAEAHGGSLSVTNAQDGQGAIATLRIPR